MPARPPVIGLSPEEIEFIAEKEPIGIIPNFSFGKINLISGDVGPFIAGLPVIVPFWLGTDFCKRMKCRILIPDWFDETTLTELKEEEIRGGTFMKMPSEHYMIIAKRLFELCPGDIRNADAVKTIIKDIWDIRMSKLRTSVTTFLGGDQTIAKVDNLTMFEIATIRPFFPHSLEQIFRVKKTLNAALAQSNDSQQDSNMSLGASGPSQSQSQSQ